jgi:hypothetical protein
VLGEALPGARRGGDHHGVPRAEAEGEHLLAVERGVDRLPEEVEVAEDGERGRARWFVLAIVLAAATATKEDVE